MVLKKSFHDLLDLKVALDMRKLRQYQFSHARFITKYLMAIVSNMQIEEEFVYGVVLLALA